MLKNLLQNKGAIYQEMFSPKNWNHLTWKFLLTSLIGLFVYGLLMATYVPDMTHWLTIGLKMILLIWGPIVLCVPSLYIFLSINGSKLSLSQLTFLLLASLAASGLVFMGFVPIVWFFTWTTESIEFVRGMNGTIIAISLGFGLFFLEQGLKYFQNNNPQEKNKKTGYKAILLLWFIILLVVTLQMAFKLSPWFTSDTLNTSNKEAYAEQNEKAQIFLGHYPEAKKIYNADQNKITYQVKRSLNENEEKRLYLQVGAQEGISGEEILYCLHAPGGEAPNEIIFQVSDYNKIQKKLETNECFKN